MEDSGEILYKHQMSCAHDAMINYVIDRQKKSITLTMKTYQKLPFISIGLLQDFIVSLVRKHDIVAFSNDNSTHWLPLKTDWIVRIKLGEACFQALIVKQLNRGECEHFSTELFAVPND